MSDPKDIAHYSENVAGNRVLCKTSQEHPGLVFVHVSSGGFNLCLMMRPVEAESLSNALKHAWRQAINDESDLARRIAAANERKEQP